MFETSPFAAFDCIKDESTKFAHSHISCTFSYWLLLLSLLFRIPYIITSYQLISISYICLHLSFKVLVFYSIHIVQFVSSCTHWATCLLFPTCFLSFFFSLLPYLKTHAHLFLSFIRSFIHFKFIRSFIHSFFHSFVRSFIHSFVHSLIHSFIHSFGRSVGRSFVRSFIHSFIHPNIHPFIPIFIFSSIHPFIHSSFHPFIRSSVHPFFLSFILFKNAFFILRFSLLFFLFWHSFKSTPFMIHSFVWFTTIPALAYMIVFHSGFNSCSSSCSYVFMWLNTSGLCMAGISWQG